MRKLVLSIAFLAIVISAASMVAAGGGSGNMAFQEQWKAVQAQQKAIAADLARIDRDAARSMTTDTSTSVSTDMWGAAAAAGSSTQRPR